MNKFIENFEITIVSDMWNTSDPMLIFTLNDRDIIVPLKEFKKMIDIIVKSKLNRSPQAYEAFNNFKSIFRDLLYPWMVIPDSTEHTEIFNILPGKDKDE